MSYNKNDPQSIQTMFGSIAKKYDRTNAILSFQMHRYWNRQLIKNTVLKKTPQSYLDLCCGTGEIAFHFLKNQSVSWEAYLLDFCSEMISYAKNRVNSFNLDHHKISYLQADAQQIPLLNESIDCITMAYGIRNIPDPLKCLMESYRVLKHQGRLGILELTQPSNPLLKVGHTFYLKNVLPLIGKWVTPNPEAYKYLCNSIQSFVEPKVLEKMIKESGFKKTEVIPLMGGIATLFIAEK